MNDINLKNNVRFDYQSFEAMKESYDNLYDDISKKIFITRLMIDLKFDPILINKLAITNSNIKSKSIDDFITIFDIIKNKQPIIIYGAGRFGQLWCQYLQEKEANVLGFFDKNYNNIKSIMNLPVMPPPEMVDNSYYVLICVMDYVIEIKNDLLKKGFKSEQLLLSCQEKEEDIEHQYFDFPEKYRPNGAFIDAGCFNGDTLIRFINWCNKQYLKVFAFEPDSENIINCKNTINSLGLTNIEFYQAGLSDKNGEAIFDSMGTSSSKISNSGCAKIKLVTIDDTIKDVPVSFIKMDIEGSELSALRGSKNTIIKNKPLCAISVYHRPADVIVIMEYLKFLVPEYKFALRHYSNLYSETVLYAFCE